MKELLCLGELIPLSIGAINYNSFKHPVAFFDPQHNRFGSFLDVFSQC